MEMRACMSELQLEADVEHRAGHFVAGEVLVVPVEAILDGDIDFAVERRERLGVAGEANVRRPEARHFRKVGR